MQNEPAIHREPPEGPNPELLQELQSLQELIDKAEVIRRQAEVDNPALENEQPLDTTGMTKEQEVLSRASRMARTYDERLSNQRKSIDRLSTLWSDLQVRLNNERERVEQHLNDLGPRPVERIVGDSVRNDAIANQARYHALGDVLSMMRQIEDR